MSRIPPIINLSSPINIGSNTEEAHVEHSLSNRNALLSSIPRSGEERLAVQYSFGSTSQIEHAQQEKLRKIPEKIFNLQEFEKQLSLLSAKYNKAVGSISELTEEISNKEKFSYLKQGRDARNFLEMQYKKDHSIVFLIQELLDYSSAPGVCRTMRKNARDAYLNKDYETAQKTTEKYTEVIELLRANGFGVEQFILYRGQAAHSHLEEGTIFCDAAPMSFSISKDVALGFALWDEENSGTIGDEDNTSIEEEDASSISDEEDISPDMDQEGKNLELPSLMYVINARTANISHFNEQLEDPEVKMVTDVSIAADKAMEAKATAEAIEIQAITQGIQDIEAKVSAEKEEIPIIKQYFNIEEASDTSQPSVIAELTAARTIANMAELDAEAKASDPEVLRVLRDSELEALSKPMDSYRIIYKGFEEFNSPKGKLKGIYHVIAERVESHQYA